MNEVTTKPKIKILIVDDHPIVREGLAARLGREPDLDVCGEAEDVADALEKVKNCQPDLVIIDLSLKSSQGLDLIKRINASSPSTRTLVSSMFDESLYAERALRAGAQGYVNKQEMSEKIVDAIRQVLDGKIYLSSPMTERLLQRAVGAPPELSKSTTDILSDRELEIFRFIGQGKTTRQIAGDLHLSIKTIETHRENIKSKLNIGNAAELSREAVRWVMENGG
ncbi:MAG: response regulator transcription factor [Planctomycetes bacterium]|jgi:DNA-binding NarL/FixJ family response regulator|nr:response regulator transcription factor [Planctomycetota bacterium]